MHRAATTSLLREPQGTPLWDPGVPAVPGGRCHLAGWHWGTWFHVAPLDCKGEVSQSSSSSVPSSTVSRGSPVAWRPVGARGQPRSGRTCRVQVEVRQAGGCFPGLPRCAALARLRIVLQGLWGRHRVRAPGTGSPHPQDPLQALNTDVMLRVTSLAGHGDRAGLGAGFGGGGAEAASLKTLPQGRHSGG